MYAYIADSTKYSLNNFLLLHLRFNKELGEKRGKSYLFLNILYLQPRPSMTHFYSKVLFLNIIATIILYKTTTFTILQLFYKIIIASDFIQICIQLAEVP